MRRRFAWAIAATVLWVQWLPVPAGGSEAAKEAKTDAAAASDAPQEENEHFWRPRTKAVAVFKNGLGFFMRDGEVTTHDGWAAAREVPPATFGTLAIYSLDKDKVVDVVGSGPGETVEFDGVDAPKTLAAKRDRLETWRNFVVQLSYNYKDSPRVAVGKLVSIGPEFVVLESDNNSFAVGIESIATAQLAELPLRIHVSADAKQPAAKARLGMAYLRQGITWIPEYSLEVLDDKTARLTLRGTLVNEAEDLIHCDVNFVVGVPHFAHTGYLAPLAVGRMIRAIGAAVAPGEFGCQTMNNALLSNNSVALAPAGTSLGPKNGAGTEQPDLSKALGNLPQLDGPGGADYTVYTKHDLTLRRGEKAIVTLFVKTIQYSNIYRWSPPAILEHSLVLHNDTDTAWTTGPCLATSAERPLSEDLLRYTPRGGQAEVPVSAAINIAHEKIEAEVDRKFKAHSPTKDVFLDLVTLQGELRLKNFEPSEVDLVIAVPVPGKPIGASDDGHLSADPNKLQLLERSGTIRWTLKLKPGESQTLKFKYDRYVPAS
ncbi:MAG TPA: hypothetical protein VHY91_00260 [Pirellulales bacterium]|jgi:hypothetical protein|nr:hypothetical protein [Pirellulales bacterium]